MMNFQTSPGRKILYTHSKSVRGGLTNVWVNLFFVIKTSTSDFHYSYTKNYKVYKAIVLSDNNPLSAETDEPKKRGIHKITN
jgi:hypothetical protein